MRVAPRIYGNGPSEIVVEDEETQVLAWKLEQLERAGFTADQALTVSSHPRWRQALRAAQLGLPTADAVELLA